MAYGNFSQKQRAACRKPKFWKTYKQPEVKTKVLL
jgi:hypothetical protein